MSSTQREPPGVEPAEAHYRQAEAALVQVEERA